MGGEWADVRLPWHVFVPVRRNKAVLGGPLLDPATIRQFGLVLSRFEFNGCVWFGGRGAGWVTGQSSERRGVRPGVVGVSDWHSCEERVSWGRAGGQAGGMWRTVWLAHC